MGVVKEDFMHVYIQVYILYKYTYTLIAYIHLQI